MSEGFDFPILIDEGGEVIEGWGLLNTFDAKGRRIPHPALVTLDLEGQVADIFIETNYRLRPSTAEVLERLRATLAESVAPTADP